MLQGWAHYWLGLVHYQWNDLETAAQHFREIVGQRYAVQSLAARQGLIGAVLVQVARGDIASARETMELLSAYDVDLLGDETEETRSVRVRLQHLQGDTVSAFRWADAFTAPVPDRPLLWPQDPHIAKARLLLARGAEADVLSALQIIDALAEIAERTHNTRFRIELLALRALALDTQGEADAAQTVLQQAIELARPGGFIRVFVDLGPRMYLLLSRLVPKGFAVDTIRLILAAFPAPDPIRTQPSVPHPAFPLIEPLTDRELEVLTLLRERFSNKEIAHKLCLSPNTVKRHAVNLYGKLGVSARRDAVVEAEALGILPPR